MQDRLVEKQEFTHNQMLIWRCVIAMAHADGEVQDEERVYIEEVFENLKKQTNISAEEMDLLKSDLENAHDFWPLFEQINDPETRSLAIHFAHLLAHKDGVLHPDEEAILNKLDADTVRVFDINRLRQDIRDYKDGQKESRIQEEKDRPRAGIAAVFDDFLDHFATSSY